MQAWKWEHYLIQQQISFQVNFAPTSKTIWNPFFPNLIFCQVQCSKNNRPFLLPGKLLYCYCIIGFGPIEVVSMRKRLDSNYTCHVCTKTQWEGAGGWSLHAWLCQLCSSLPFIHDWFIAHRKVKMAAHKQNARVQQIPRSNKSLFLHTSVMLFFQRCQLLSSRTFITIALYVWYEDLTPSCIPDSYIISSNKKRTTTKCILSTQEDIWKVCNNYVMKTHKILTEVLRFMHERV